MADVRAETGDAPLEPRARSNSALAVWRLLRVGAWTFYSYSVYMAARLTAADIAERRRRAARETHRWLEGLAKIIGVSITVKGQTPEPPVLLTPNHLGYLDIMAVGAACPALFVSRSDVEDWPIVGHLFKMSEQIGISRSDRRSVAGVNDKIGERFDAGVPVCVFLEGTSSSGDTVMPFHASLVQPAIERRVPVAPVGLRWESAMPGTVIGDDIAYWKPEHVFGAHLWRMLGLSGIRVTVTFGQPIAAGGTDRKALAAVAREHVLQLVAHAQAGE